MAIQRKDRIDELVEKLQNIGIKTDRPTVSVYLKHLADWPLESLLNHCQDRDLKRWYGDAEVVVHSKLERLLTRLWQGGIILRAEDLLSLNVSLDELLFLSWPQLKARVSEILP